jgi:prepilin-type N-terminal cleavage/methylation domain-containing protein
MGRFLSLRRGFGVIELIVVVSILGGAFLMALKGEVLVNRVKAVLTADQIERIQYSIQSYTVQFNNMLPGDDGRAPKRWNRDLSTFLVNGREGSFMDDGIIQGSLSDPENVNGEQYMAWRDLRFAEILDGDPNLHGESARPENLFGGFFAFAEENLGLQQVLCLTEVPGLAAAHIDKALDDGRIATGRLRGTSRWDPARAKNQFAEPDSIPYDPEKTYIICLPYLP